FRSVGWLGRSARSPTLLGGGSLAKTSTIGSHMPSRNATIHCSRGESWPYLALQNGSTSRSAQPRGVVRTIQARRRRRFTARGVEVRTIHQVTRLSAHTPCQATLPVASRTRPPRTDPIRRFIFASCPVMTGSARAAKPTRGPLARFDPSRAAPLPARLGPVRPEPRFDRPPEPDHADPIRLGPIRPEPRAAPVRAGPVRAGGRADPSRPPVRTEPDRAEPDRAEPDRAGAWLGFTRLPVRAGPVRAGPPPRPAVRPPSGSRPPSGGRPFRLGDAAREPPPDEEALLRLAGRLAPLRAAPSHLRRVLRRPRRAP